VLKFGQTCRHHSGMMLGLPLWLNEKYSSFLVFYQKIANIGFEVLRGHGHSNIQNQKTLIFEPLPISGKININLTLCLNVSVLTLRNWYQPCQNYTAKYYVIIFTITNTVAPFAAHSYSTNYLAGSKRSTDS